MFLASTKNRCFFVLDVKIKTILFIYLFGLGHSVLDIVLDKININNNCLFCLLIKINNSFLFGNKKIVFVFFVRNVLTSISRYLRYNKHPTDFCMKSQSAKGTYPNKTHFLLFLHRTTKHLFLFGYTKYGSIYYRALFAVYWCNMKLSYCLSGNNKPNNKQKNICFCVKEHIDLFGLCYSE